MGVSGAQQAFAPRGIDKQQEQVCWAAWVAWQPGTIPATRASIQQAQGHLFIIKEYCITFNKNWLLL